MYKTWSILVIIFSNEWRKVEVPACYEHFSSVQGYDISFTVFHFLHTLISVIRFDAAPRDGICNCVVEKQQRLLCIPATNTKLNLNGLIIDIVAIKFCSLLGAGRRPSQGFASAFSYYLSCYEFPERLQSLNSDIEPGY